MSYFFSSKKKKEWRSFPQSFVFCDAIPAFFFWWVLTIHYTQQQKIKRSRRKKSKWNADAAHKLKKNKNKERIWLITELILSSILKKAFFFFAILFRVFTLTTANSTGPFGTSVVTKRERIALPFFYFLKYNKMLGGGVVLATSVSFDTHTHTQKKTVKMLEHPWLLLICFSFPFCVCVLNWKHVRKIFWTVGRGNRVRVDWCQHQSSRLFVSSLPNPEKIIAF